MAFYLSPSHFVCGDVFILLVLVAILYLHLCALLWTLCPHFVHSFAHVHIHLIILGAAHTFMIPLLVVVLPLIFHVSGMMTVHPGSGIIGLRKTLNSPLCTTKQKFE